MRSKPRTNALRLLSSCGARVDGEMRMKLGDAPIVDFQHRVDGAGRVGHRVLRLVEPAGEHAFLDQQRRVDRFEYRLQFRLEHLAKPMRQRFARDR